MKKHKKSEKTKRIERLDKMWAEIIKIKAKYKSELSGDDTMLQSHHAYGKKTNALRYDIRGGICLTNKEHIWGVHSSDPSISSEYQKNIEEYLKNREGSNIFDILAMQKNNTGTNLDMIEFVLKEELKRLKQ